MTITHHLDDATLLSFAAGGLPEALAAVAAAHIALCPRCGREARRMDRLGGAVLEALSPVALQTRADDAWSRGESPAPFGEGLGVEGTTPNVGALPLRRIKSGAGSNPPPRGGRGASLPSQAALDALPPALAALIGGDLDDVRWRFVAFGVWAAPVTLSPKAKGALRLVKAAPGQAIPDHGHGGGELTLVLRGAYADKTGRYGPGDVADLDEDVEHRPIADPETGCICLLASENLARFRGAIPRLVQPFTRI